MSAYVLPHKAVAVTKSDTAYITDQVRTSVSDANIVTTSFASNVITKVAHGYSEGDIINCSNPGTSSLVATTLYYVKYLSSSTFSVAATLGGAAVSMGATTTTPPTFNRLSTLDPAKRVNGSLFCGGAGDVIVLPEGHLDTDDPTVCNAGAQKFTLAAGQILPGHFKKLFNTGTTATGVVCQHGI